LAGDRLRAGAFLLAGAVVVLSPCACSDGTARKGESEALAQETGVAVEGEAISPNIPLPESPQPLAEETPAVTTQSLNQSRTTALVRAAGRVAPAVVSVNVLRQQQVRARTVWDFGDVFLGPSRSRPSTGFGSGIVFRSDGYILTNDHVIRGAQQIRVTFPDGRDFEAQLTGSDGLTDVAVLKVDAVDLPVAPLGTSRGLLIGEWAMAIGNPFAYLLSNSEPTVTAGVVSAAGRHIIPSNQDQGFYLGMIQTDASINPGNSGGPLVNALGEVIGVNTSIFSRSGGSEGLGFAIPIDRALRVAEDLIQFGEVRRAWTGLDVEAVEADVWGHRRGVQIVSVAPGSPADEAGLSPGDRLVEVNGKPLGTPLDFEAVLLDAKAGDGVDVAIEGRRRPMSLVTETLPTSRAERVEILEDLEVISVTPGIRAEQGLGSEAGALITGISASLSRTLGLARGDVIFQINENRVATAEDAGRALRELGSGMLVRIYFERNGMAYFREFRTRR